jgi:polynucleotide 5'-hydroxyl-kinase GRC3/NOL9
VAYMDCDPGQCEFTLSGCISLSILSDPVLGPPHTHLSHTGATKKCYFLGHLSPNDVPGLYLDMLRQCLHDFNSYKQFAKTDRVPLIVNTMGWNQGLGLCILKETIIMFKPTHLIQINHHIEQNKNMPVLDKEWLNNADGWPPARRVRPLQDENSNDSRASTARTNQVNYDLLTLKSRAPVKTVQFAKKSPQKRFSPRDHRNIAVLAYFSRMQEPSVFRSVHHLKPLRVSWNKLALHVSHTRVDYDQLLRAFNATLVGLCYVDPAYVSLIGFVC